MAAIQRYTDCLGVHPGRILGIVVGSGGGSGVRGLSFSTHRIGMLYLLLCWTVERENAKDFAKLKRSGNVKNLLTWDNNTCDNIVIEAVSMLSIELAPWTSFETGLARLGGLTLSAPL